MVRERRVSPRPPCGEGIYDKPREEGQWGAPANQFLSEMPQGEGRGMVAETILWLLSLWDTTLSAQADPCLLNTL